MQHVVYTHHLHGLSTLVAPSHSLSHTHTHARTPDGAARTDTASSLGAPFIDEHGVANPLLSSDGDRLLAVGIGMSVDLYDCACVSEHTHMTGTGSARFRCLASFIVRDVGVELEVLSVHFLTGGTLAVVARVPGMSTTDPEAGVSMRTTSACRAVIHVYKLAISASVPLGPDGSGSTMFTSSTAYTHAPVLTHTALPHIVYRAALEGVTQVRLIVHPTMPHVFGIVLNDDKEVRFYDASPEREPGTGASAHVCTLTHRCTVTSATFSKDGAMLAITSIDREVAVFDVEYDSDAAAETTAPRASASTSMSASDPLMRVHVRGKPVTSQQQTARPEQHKHVEAGASKGTRSPRAAAELKRDAGSTLIRTRSASPRPASAQAEGVGTRGFRLRHVRSFLAESDITAVSFMRIPTHPDAGLFARFRYNGVCIVTGHANGFINVWWLGALPVQDAGSSAAYVVGTESIVSYPPFHASRGPIRFITEGVTVDEGHFGKRTAVFTGSNSAPSTEGGKPAVLTTSTLIAVGAAGARGWRVYAFDHICPASPTSSADGREEHPNYIPGHFEWDGRGRKRYVPPAPRRVEHLLVPCIHCPSYAECLRAPIIGDAAWASSVGSALPTPAALSVGTGGPIVAAPRVAAGIVPLGCAVLQRRPNADDALSSFRFKEAGEKGGASHGVLSSRLAAPVLTGSAIVADEGVFRLLCRAEVASFRHPAPAGAATHGAALDVGGAPASSARSVLGEHVGSIYTTDSNIDAPPSSALGEAPPRYLQAPRIVLLLLTERGIHAAGFDYHPALVASSAAAARAAEALKRVQEVEKRMSSAHAQRVSADSIAQPTAAASQAQQHECHADSTRAEHAEMVQPPTSDTHAMAAPPPGAVHTSQVIREDVAATLRARHYWPSAAVSSVVTGVRRTIFTPPAPPVRMSARPRVRVEKHDAAGAAEDHAPLRETTGQHANTAPRLVRVDAAKGPPTDVEADVDSNHRVYTTAELDYMPRHYRQRLLQRAAPPPPPNTGSQSWAGVTTSHGAQPTAPPTTSSPTEQAVSFDDYAYVPRGTRAQNTSETGDRVDARRSSTAEPLSTENRLESDDHSQATDNSAAASTQESPTSPSSSSADSSSSSSSESSSSALAASSSSAPSEQSDAPATAAEVEAEMRRLREQVDELRSALAFKLGGGASTARDDKMAGTRRLSSGAPKLPAALGAAEAAAAAAAVMWAWGDQVGSSGGISPATPQSFDEHQWSDIWSSPSEEPHE